jgi:hypothetical protein
MHTKGNGMKKELTEEQQKKLNELQEMPDEEIDYWRPCLWRMAARRCSNAT